MTKHSKNVVSDIKVKRLSENDHVIHRLTMYAGSKKRADHIDFTVTDNKVEKVIYNYSPALVKIISEIIDNSVDEHNRGRGVNAIDVSYNPENYSITVSDDGGIPVKIEPEFGKYIPEIIFGMLRTSTNYDDDEKTALIGTNGLGAKLTAICSTSFTVDTCDGINAFKQVYEDNLKVKSEPLISPDNQKGTSINFIPQYELFETNPAYDTDFIDYIKFYLTTLAINYPTCEFFFNGEKIAETTETFMQKLSKQYISAVTDNWNVNIAVTEEYNHISFVNGVYTRDGGTHVNIVTNYICDKLEKTLKRKFKLTVKASNIKNYLTFYISCRVTKPSFDSQTKTRLVSNASDFCEDPESVLDALIEGFIKSDFFNDFIELIRAEQNAKDSKLVAKLEKSNKSILRSIDKYSDVNGTSDVKYLFLAEGDSAYGSILSARDPAKHAVFSLRGIPKNGYIISYKELLLNKEFNELIKILAFYNYDFDRIVIASDADHHGYNICALLCTNFFKHIPAIADKIYRLNTPNIIAKYKNQVFEFYSLPEYEEWQKTMDGKKYTYSYVKGLGTWESEEMERFVNDEKYYLKIYKDEFAEDAMDLAFSKDGKLSTDARKEWLRTL